jgi:hypothetical protein
MAGPPSCSALATWSPGQAKSAAKTDGASFTTAVSISQPMSLAFTQRFSRRERSQRRQQTPGSGARSRPQRYPALSSCLARQRAAPRSPSGREADESRDSSSRHEPFAHFLIVLTAAQDDAADFVATGLPRGGSSCSSNYHGRECALIGSQASGNPLGDLEHPVAQALHHLPNHTAADHRLANSGASARVRLARNPVDDRIGVDLGGAPE